MANVHQLPSSGSTSDSPGLGSQHWEGDGTLHSYCYDYMRKRGWTDTASAFAADAGINEDIWDGPPIEAPQGLLYEWWSVFWDVFIARSQKTGQRNVIADTYVEAMRTKVDPLQVNFPGTSTPSISLPRSLAHPSRIPISGGSNAQQQQQQQQMHHQQQQQLQMQQQNHSAPPLRQQSYTNPGQMHVLQQQQLQDQLQRNGQLQSAGGSNPPGMSTQQMLAMQSQPQQHFQPQPPPSPMGQPNQARLPPPPPLLPQAQGQHTSSMPPSQSSLAYNGNQGPPGTWHPSMLHSDPQRPESALSLQHPSSSPHLNPASHPTPYHNGNVNGHNGLGGPSGAGQRTPGGGAMAPGTSREGGSGLQISGAFLQALVVVGLAGRDPEGLTPEEAAAVSNQMRRTNNQHLPPGVLQQPHAVAVQQQQMQQQQQQQQQQMSSQQQQMQPQHFRNQPNPQMQSRVPAQRLHPDQQRAQVQYAPQTQPAQDRHTHQQQLAHQQQLQQREHQQMQQQRLQAPGGLPPGRNDLPPGYSTSQIGSPASPAYSAGASPFATPIQQHLAMPPPLNSQLQPSPQSLPQNRAVGAPIAGKNRAGIVRKVSPVNGASIAGAQNGMAKRGGIPEDGSPRSRKRARGSVKDEDANAAAAAAAVASVLGVNAETPRFDGSDPSSPALSLIGIPGQGQGQFAPLPPGYRPSPSPSSNALELSGRVGLSTNARMLVQQKQATDRLETALNSLQGDSSREQLDHVGGLMNGVIGIGLGQLHQTVNGHHGTNGMISRPSSSSSNYLNTTSSFPGHIEPHKLSPTHSPHPPPTPGTEVYSIASRSPNLTIALPPPLPPGAFQLVNGGPDATPGGSRPFAGATNPSNNSTPHPLMTLALPSAGLNMSTGSHSGDVHVGEEMNMMDTTTGYQQFEGGNMFEDLSTLDFSFDSFIDFQDDQSLGNLE